MKKNSSIKKIGILAMSVIALNSYAQTPGTLSFEYSPTAHPNGYDGSKNTLAIWIQKADDSFVKTRVRYCCGGSTNDHLPVWAVNAGGFASFANFNTDVTDATTGATLPDFQLRSINWDGTDVNGNVVPDGTYKVSVESTWNHGATNHIIRSFTFTKGTSIDNQTPANDAEFNNVSLIWTPSTTNSIDETNTSLEVVAYPNPSNGMLNIKYNNATSIKIVNMIGEVIVNDNLINENNGTYTADLSAYANGIYNIIISNGDQVTTKKITLNK